MAEDEDFPGRLLHQVALWDNVEFLTDLLKDDEHKKFINSRDAWGRTALHAACTNEGSGCLEILISAGALVDTPCGSRGNSRTPLHISAHIGCPKNIKTLINHNANLMLLDSDGFTALDIALNTKNTACSEILKDATDSWEESQNAIHMVLRDAISRGDISSTKTILSELGSNGEFIVNMAPNGSTTLLYCACEVGRKDIVKMLLDHKADGRIHPITRYSPLYIVAFKGKKDIMEILLKKFPELVQQTTVEKWLPIHAACINGNIQVLEFLLRYPYPSSMLIKLRKDNWEFDVPFDINTKDVNGQTVLYLACLLGNSKIVDILLKYQVKAIKKCAADGTFAKDDNSDITKRSRISEGIQSIVSRLRGSLTKENDLNEKYLKPVDVNVYCNEEAPETALHAAVRNCYKDVVVALLENGSDPNLLTLQPNSDYKPKDDDVREAGCSPLTLACGKGDTAIVELLLKHGARDDDCKALAAAMITKNQHLITTLLGTKAFADPEHKINKKAMTDNIATQFGGLSSLTYSNIFPSTPVMINWHSQRCKLESIKSQWLIDAALHINPRLKVNPRNREIVLFAITRLDISNNSLTRLPAIIFQLQSLRYLNLAQNKIEKLPDPNDSNQVTSPTSKKMSKLYKSIYTANVLEEIYLQDNRLDKIPEELFRLPSLTTLDLSNNKLHSVPFQMWHAPKLKDLNMSFNLIKELPYAQSEEEARSLREKSVGRIPILDKVFEKEINVSDVDENISLIHHNVWSRSIEIMEQIARIDDTSEVKSNSSQLSSLNLSHNRFSSIPPVLSCLAVNLTRLNMSYNCLRTMSYITSYPSSLKQLDLSHNKICVWPSLPQINLEESAPDQENLLCYRLETGQVPKSTVPTKIRTSRRMSLRASILNRVCSHRRHLRLENLRTLMLADNCMNRIQLSTDDDGFSSVSNDSADELDDWDTGGTVLGHSKSKLIFPNLSMLDLSNNQLKEIPPNINELINLSVLNISGNKDVTELPSQMGLLSRLWNLNTRGCSLQEPLKSMIDSNKYKTMDVIGYLKSVLEDAKPYARMKLMIVGVQGIGKTSLLDQLRQASTGNYKKKPVDHWAKRMGNKNINQKTSKGTNISTVGVDIDDWVYEKKVRGNSPYGPVMFRTWDFGGQNEYYATHQYFLSKRSLYIVVWKITDGHRGIAEILQWLVNIQARAPNSPVIIVGTHYDVVSAKSPEYHSEQLQQLIRDKFINIVDAEKYGLPRVLDTIEISCKTKHNIKLLCNIIYDTVFSLRPPGSKELLLEQRVPATYLALEDIVSHIGSERRLAGLDPVLNLDQFRTAVNAEMLSRHHKTFRDMAELNQAILFLHENGVLLHYDDATLKDLYFLDPQWLCDMLAHVVTIREINPFARSGVMKLDDLQIVLKSSTCTREYIVNLLNKFEVALTWDSRSLLIPSLLPSEEDMFCQRAQPISIKVPVKSKTRQLRNRTSSQPMLDLINIEEYITSRSDPEVSVRRLLLMSYFPSGFWSRLITRILGDDAIINVIRQFFMPTEVNGDDFMCSDFQTYFDWILWQTGIELKFANKITLFRMKEVLHRNSPINYRHLRFKLFQENSWFDVPMKTSSILETYLPLDTVIIKRPIKNKNEEDIGFRAIVLDPSPVQAAKLLALVVDHIDVLLEDWYPTLGTRFVHTSEGKCLVTRLVPCPRCLVGSVESDNISIDMKDDDGTSKIDHISKEFLKRDLDSKNIVRKSQESYNGSDGGDSGVGHDVSPQSSRKVSVDDNPLNSDDQVEGDIHYGWIVEDCILAASSVDRLSVVCPKHGDLPLAQVAPDTVFLDLGEELVINDEDIIRGKLLGRGAFGFVFKGVCKGKKRGNSMQIAIKMLQPVPPGPNASQSAIIAYKGAQAKWDRDPLQYTCKSYCSARQELNIMLNLKHPNIVPLIGVCTKPLALILDLAPMGALDQILRNYRRSGSKFDPHVLQQTIFQIAKALEYLHQQRIIYRDLKSENVLVWSIPAPLQDPYAVNTHVKMADYGISRLSLPSGTKGFGGTEGFMAPEIIKYNGEEEYTEKVDCFSFGMFIYELITMHQPFENHESVKESILEGHRPALTYRETAYPSYLLDLMAVCWSQSPKDRPSASQIVSIVSAPEFTHLYDVVSLSHSADVVSCTRVPLPLSEDDENSGNEIWLPCSNGKLDRLAFSNTNWFHYRSSNVTHTITSICTIDDNNVWLGDAEGQIHAYSSNDSKYMFSYKLTTVDQEVGVKCIVTLKDRHRVAVGLENGRIFLVRSDMSPLAPTMGEGSFVMSELGSSTVLYDFIAVYSNKTCELWCGEDQGRISVYTIKQNVAINFEVLEHFEYTGLETQVMSLSTTHDHKLVWSYVHPDFLLCDSNCAGCIVYQWDVATRKIMNKLDCSKLIPCSESLKSISIEERLSPGKCQITSLCAVGDELYLGTAWGCIVVVEQDTARPITVFRPYEEEVTCITASGEGNAVISIGHGYRSLLKRYLSHCNDMADVTGTTFAILWSTLNWNAY